MSNGTISGWVVRLQSGFYTVQTEQAVVTCGIRGRLKRVNEQGDFIAVGDRVVITILPEGSGVIEEIQPRHSALVRKDPTPRGEYRQILLANPDQVILVFACAQPDPHLRMLDRFLVVAEKEKLPAVIVANKTDLLSIPKAKEIFGGYPPLGYQVVYTSVVNGTGIEEIHKILEGKISALAGPSGAGKSSLLNIIQPGLGLKIGSLKSITSKGKHTTNVREMFPLRDGGFVADLPGLRTVSLWDTQPEELDGYFPEMRHRVADCQFNDCTHQHEPGCAILNAVNKGEITRSRYESYVRLRMGDAG